MTQTTQEYSARELAVFDLNRHAEFLNGNRGHLHGVLGVATGKDVTPSDAARGELAEAMRRVVSGVAGGSRPLPPEATPYDTAVWLVRQTAGMAPTLEGEIHDARPLARPEPMDPADLLPMATDD